MRTHKPLTNRQMNSHCLIRFKWRQIETISIHHMVIVFSIHEYYDMYFILCQYNDKMHYNFLGLFVISYPFFRIFLETCALQRYSSLNSFHVLRPRIFLVLFFRQYPSTVYNLKNKISKLFLYFTFFWINLVKIHYKGPPCFLLHQWQRYTTLKALKSMVISLNPCVARSLIDRSFPQFSLNLVTLRKYG